MLQFLVAPVLSFLGGPVIKGFIDGYKAKLEAGNTKERIAADLAARELEVQKREIEVNKEYKTSLIGHWYEPVQLLGYIMVFYLGKCIVFDAALGLGTTDALRGDVLTWAGMIMLFYVGQRTIVNAISILKR